MLSSSQRYRLFRALLSCLRHNSFDSVTRLLISSSDTDSSCAAVATVWTFDAASTAAVDTAVACELVWLATSVNRAAAPPICSVAMFTSPKLLSTLESVISELFSDCEFFLLRLKVRPSRLLVSGSFLGFPETPRQPFAVSQFRHGGFHRL